MKKIVISAAIIITFLCLNTNKKIIIPKDSIRFRVVSNSNSKEEQQLKEKIVYNLKEEIGKIEYSSTDINNTRKQIQKEIPKFNEIITSTLKEAKSNSNYTINYGNNYFPEKEYDGIKYQEGEYESLVITIGSGQGDNFWCVLFPPLCVINPIEDNDKVEYTSFIKKIIAKYF